MRLAFLLPALNHLLASAGWARQRLQPHAGSIARIAAGDAALSLRIAADGFFAAVDGEEAQVEILLPPLSALLQSALGGGESFASYLAHAEMRGRVEFAETLAFVLRNLHWDFEGDLAALTGDIAAHRIARACAQGRQFSQTLAVRAADGLLQGSRHFVAPLLLQRPVFGAHCSGIEDLLLRLRRLQDRLP